MRTLLHTHTHTHNIGCVLSFFLAFFLFVRVVCVSIFSHSLALSVVVALVPMGGVERVVEEGGEWVSSKYMVYLLLCVKL
jgi:hypothetical protein